MSTRFAPETPSVPGALIEQVGGVQRVEQGGDGPPVLLVVAKAPVPGEAKTRLAATFGVANAAILAAACLLDTLERCERAVGAHRCHLALVGDLRRAVEAEEITRRLRGWTVRHQRGASLGERLAAAHRDVGQSTGRAVVQVGMDTPHLDPAVLVEAAAALAEHDAVLGPAEDGGWWLLGLRGPEHAAALREIPTSTPRTGADTAAALRVRGLAVAAAPPLRDVDTAADAAAVALVMGEGRFPAAWRAIVAEESA